MFKKFLDKNSQSFYFVFRVIIGLVFLLHGIQKLPGIVSGTTSIFSLFGLAGIIELVVGVLIIIGLFVRYASIVAALEMLVAYFYIHVGSSMVFNPLVNKGEAAVLFFAAFLILMTQGAGKWALDSMAKRR